MSSPSQVRVGQSQPLKAGMKVYLENVQGGSVADLDSKTKSKLIGWTLDPSHGDSQYWIVDEPQEGQYTLKNANTGGYLTAPARNNGTQITISKTPFRWRIRPGSRREALALESATHTNAMLCNAYGKPHNGNTIWMWSFAPAFHDMMSWYLRMAPRSPSSPSTSQSTSGSVLSGSTMPSMPGSPVSQSRHSQSISSVSRETSGVSDEREKEMREQEEALRKKEEDLQARDTALGEREKTLEDRESELKHRAKKLDEEDAELKQREEVLQRQEADQNQEAESPATNLPAATPTTPDEAPSTTNENTPQETSKAPSPCNENPSEIPENTTQHITPHPSTTTPNEPPTDRATSLEQREANLQKLQTHLQTQKQSLQTQLAETQHRLQQKADELAAKERNLDKRAAVVGSAATEMAAGSGEGRDRELEGEIEKLRVKNFDLQSAVEEGERLRGENDKLRGVVDAGAATTANGGSTEEEKDGQQALDAEDREKTRRAIARRDVTPYAEARVLREQNRQMQQQILGLIDSLKVVMEERDVLRGRERGNETAVVKRGGDMGVEGGEFSIAGLGRGVGLGSGASGPGAGGGNGDTGPFGGEVSGKNGLGFGGGMDERFRSLERLR